MHRKLVGRAVAATHNKGKLAELQGSTGAERRRARRRRRARPARSRRRPATLSSPMRSSRRGRRPRRSGSAGALRRFRPLRRRARRRAGHLFGALGARTEISRRRWRASRRSLSARAAKRPWRAWFVSALAIAWPDGHVETFEGRVDGELVFPPRGTRGFGYDPCFLPDGHALHLRRDDGAGEARPARRRLARLVASRARLPGARPCLSVRGGDDRSRQAQARPEAQIRAGAGAARAVLPGLLEVRDFRRDRRDDGRGAGHAGRLLRQARPTAADADGDGGRSSSFSARWRCIFHNDTFIKIKPTVLYCLFSAALFFGLAFRRPILQIMFDGALHLTEAGWRILTWRWAFFFLFLAALNEICLAPLFRERLGRRSSRSASCR